MSNLGPPSGEFNQLDPSIFTSDNLFKQFTEFNLTGIPLESITESDKQRNYSINSNGFRGPEFKAVDLLTAGCSQTFGMGVEEEQTWPHLTAKFLGSSYANLGIPGTSNQRIVESIIFYIKKYGAPKTICVNFPSLYRFRFALKAGILEYPYPKQKYTNNYQSHLFDINMITPNSYLKPTKEWPKYNKRPYDISTSVPYEAALYLSMMSINHLIEYCSVANIDLFFTTWYLDTDLTFLEKIKKHKKMQKQSTDYVGLDMSGYLRLENLETFYYGPELVECHKEHKKYNNWDRGTDTGGHMGAHQHLHYAEMFYNAIKDKTK